MKPKVFLFFLYTHFFISASAQPSPIDSLKNVINTSKNEIIGVGLSVAQKNTMTKTEIIALQPPTGSKMNYMYASENKNTY